MKMEFPRIGLHLGSVSSDVVLSSLQGGIRHHESKFESFLTSGHIPSENRISNIFHY